ncbi:MAG: 30S ribosomal protein S12 methylthiotransferase RimO [Deltaproteobacteria bacterium]|nr:30S ribosomal protein S12 methylthiotransferase RimO [Deltaproteobacteria bacterium]
MKPARTLQKKVHLVSLGCARNLVDSEVMLGSLFKNGWKHTAEPGSADAVIINTCGFIQSAKEESIDTILSMAELKKTKPDMKLVVTGCLSQRYKKQLATGLPEVDFFLGTDQFTDIDTYLFSPPEKGTVIAKRTHALYNEELARVNTLSPFSAYVKVAEGCQHNCSFCIIPAIRGRLRSRTISSVVKEVTDLVNQGVKEVVLIAQDLAAFGRDRDKDELVELLKALAAVDGLQWIRQLYMYPENISDELLDLMAGEQKIVKYLDVPVQHASDKILKKMNRILSREEMTNVFRRVRQKVPEIAIRTTIMVGFPGESDEDFALLRDFVKEMRFEHLGCFSYSQEEGTVAGRMQEQVPDEIKEARLAEIMEVQQKISREKLQTHVGKTYPVLITGTDPENEARLLGRLATQAPDVDGLVYIEDGDALISGDVVPVRITEAFEYDLKGQARKGV